MIGWLHTAARYATKTVAREELRRKQRETEFAIQRSGSQNVSPDGGPLEADWKELAPIVDEMVAQLSRADREAILLRYYRNLTFVELGAEIGCTEEAARKRVDRAVEKLRRAAAQKGLSCGATLPSLLVSQIRTAPPNGLLATSTVAATAPPGSALAASCDPIIKGIVVMESTKSMLAVAGIIAAAVLLVALGGAVIWWSKEPKANSSSIAAAPSRVLPPDPATEPQWATPEPTTRPDQILADSLVSMDFPTSYTCRVETEERYGVPLYNIDGETIVSTQSWDGARFDGMVVNSRIVGATTKPYRTSRGIWDGKQYIIRSDNPEVPSPPSVEVTTEHEIVDRLSLAASRLDIDGCYRGRPLAAILRDSGKAKFVGAETVGADLCTVIEGKTANGYIKIWLDQQKGLRCAKAIVHLGAGDIVGARGDKLPDKASSIAQIDVATEGISFRTFGKYLLPESGTITETTRFTDGRSDFRMTTTQKRIDVRVDPNFESEKAFVMDGIPNGTPVDIHYDGARMDDPFHYVWRDGRIVKDDDAATTDKTDKGLPNEDRTQINRDNP
jgi:hypothetical protein